jgi:hypothetical protein
LTENGTRAPRALFGRKFPKLPYIYVLVPKMVFFLKKKRKKEKQRKKRGFEGGFGHPHGPWGWLGHPFASLFFFLSFSYFFFFLKKKRRGI